MPVQTQAGSGIPDVMAIINENYLSAQTSKQHSDGACKAWRTLDHS